MEDYHSDRDLNAVAGASKRGWATWTVAAVDKRVTVFIPIVIPILDMSM